MYRIIGLDPGGTTGWAALTVKSDGIMDWRQGQLGPGEHHQALWSLLELEHVGDTFIVCESFEYRNDSRPGLVLISSEYIGIAKLFARQRNVPLWLQTASEGKVRKTPSAFVKPENLKKLGLYHASQKHAMDATGHILYWMLNTMKRNPESPVSPVLYKYLLQKGWS